jgi:hypothetical protein
MADQIVYRGPSSMFLLFLTFMCLKLTNTINWSWWIVTAPLWGGIALITIVVIIIFAAAGLLWIIAELIDKFRK